MDSSQIERLCQNVAFAVAAVRTVFRSSLPVPEVLNRYWALQDNLSRLLEAVTDQPSETLEVLEAHPGLLTDVVDVLEFSSKLQMLKGLAAVREAGESINNSLLEIQYLKQSHSLAASA